MSTFNFETTTIINSITAPGFAGKTAHSGATTIKDHPRFWVDAEDTFNPVLRIARGGRFARQNISSIVKRAWEDPEYFQVTFDMTKATAKLSDQVTNLLGRLVIKVELQGSNDVIYSDAYSRHIKPFYIEFPVSASDKGKESDLAKKVARIANKYGNLVYGDLQLNVNTDGTKVVVTGTDEYQRVVEASLEIYNEAHQTFDCCAAFGDYEYDSDGVLVNQGKPGVGTYRQLVKDLVLPTEAHREWANPFEDEAPILGGHYNEYTITLCVERPGLGGLSAVGQQIVSTTMHTFFVLDDGSTDAKVNPSLAFEALLVQLSNGIEGMATTADKDYDDVAVDKDKLEDSYNDSAAIKNVQTEAQGKNLTDSESIVTPKGLKNGKRQPASATTGGSTGGSGSDSGTTQP